MARDPATTRRDLRLISRVPHKRHCPRWAASSQATHLFVTNAVNAASTLWIASYARRVLAVYETHQMQLKSHPCAPIDHRSAAPNPGARVPTARTPTAPAMQPAAC